MSLPTRALPAALLSLYVQTWFRATFPIAAGAIEGADLTVVSEVRLRR